MAYNHHNYTNLHNIKAAFAFMFTFKLKCIKEGNILKPNSMLTYKLEIRLRELILILIYALLKIS